MTTTVPIVPPAVIVVRPITVVGMILVSTDTLSETDMTVGESAVTVVAGIVTVT